MFAVGLDGLDSNYNHIYILFLNNISIELFVLLFIRFLYLNSTNIISKLNGRLFSLIKMDIKNFSSEGPIDNTLRSIIFGSLLGDAKLEMASRSKNALLPFL